MQNNFSKEEIHVYFAENKEIIFSVLRDIAENTLLELPENNALENGEEHVQFLEGCSYDYELPPGYKLKEIPKIIQASRRKDRENTGRIFPNIYVGRLPLTIVGKEGETYDIAVEVRSIKAEYRSEYRKMLEDITFECTELLMLHSSPVTQRITIDYSGDSQTLYQRFAFVKSIVDSDTFRNAVQRIISMPATGWAQKSEELDIRRARRFGSSQIRQITSRSDRVNIPENHFLTSKLSSLPAKLTSNIKIDTVDTPENRFVKYVLSEFARFCGVVAQHIENNYKESSKLVIYGEAKALENKFSEYLNHGMFKEVGVPVSLPLNSPVLQRKAGYREVLRVWLMYDLAAKLVWAALEDSYQVGKRDVATLYEYWLFFKLLRLVESIFEVNPKETKDLIISTSDKLCLQLKAGVHTAVEGEYIHKGRELSIKFNYNRTFGARDYPQSGSWTQSMRPDYTLSLWPKAFSEGEAEKQELIVHVHFDAKYKVEGLEYFLTDENFDLNEEKEMQKEGSYKRADLLKMHAYKDAIRRTVGAYVLYPGTQQYKRKGFHEIVPGLGAFPVSPSSNGQDLEVIREFINEVVEHFCNRASQREQLSFHQYAIHKKKNKNEIHEVMPEFYSNALGIKGKNRVKPAAESTVLIGYYNADQYEWIKEKGLYNIRIDPKNGMAKYGAGEVGAKYLLLHGSGKLKTSDIWEIVSEAPELISKVDLIKEKGYPRVASCESYLLFSIKPLDSKYFGNKEWDVGRLLESREGHHAHRPFSVTLAELFQSIA